MLACEKGCLRTVQALVQAGCRTMLRNAHGRTGWDLAKACGHAAITDWLTERADEDKALAEELEQLKAKPMETQRQEDTEVLEDRLHVWSTERFGNWKRIGGGAYGDIYLVTDVFPALEVQGRRVSSVVVKTVKQATEEQVRIPAPAQATSVAT